MEQNTTQKGKDYAWIFTTFVLVGGAIYAYFSFTAPTTVAAQKLGLVGIKLSLIQITFTIPFIATWVTGAIAAGRLKRYARGITDASIREGYSHLANGIIWLVVGRVVAQLVGLPINFYQENLSLVVFLSVLINYINTFFPLMGFIFFFHGAKRLSSAVKVGKDIDFTSAIIVALLGIMYSLLVFTNHARQVSLVADIPPTYYIPDIFIVFTIIIPILVAWWFGFRAALTIGETQFPQSIKGNGITQLMTGIWLVVFSSIILQGIVSLGTARFISFGLGITLGLLYLFLIVIGIGYWFMAAGSKKLLDQT